MDLPWYLAPASPIDMRARAAAAERQDQLLKPPGSLGRFESLAIDFAGWQGLSVPRLKPLAVRVFAADHGVTRRGVSAFPQEVTGLMVASFVTGGAAISVLSRSLDADFKVINMGTVAPVGVASERLVDVSLAPGTADFVEGPAMTPELCQAALAVGRDEILSLDEAFAFVGGEMGIGNTSSASAICGLLLDLSAADTVGPGTGVAGEVLVGKRDVVQAGIDLHRPSIKGPLDVLERVGGLEIAGLAGAYIASAQKGLPVIVDGFITTAAALVAVNLNPTVADWFMYSHRSAEPAHRMVLEHLGAEPLLDLGLRLGEGSGAALVAPLLQSAVRLHAEMGTLDQVVATGPGS